MLSCLFLTLSKVQMKVDSSFFTLYNWVEYGVTPSNPFVFYNKRCIYTWYFLVRWRERKLKGQMIDQKTFRIRLFQQMFMHLVPIMPISFSDEGIKSYPCPYVCASINFYQTFLSLCMLDWFDIWSEALEEWVIMCFPFSVYHISISICQHIHLSWTHFLYVNKRIQ